MFVRNHSFLGQKEKEGLAQRNGFGGFRIFLHPSFFGKDAVFVRQEEAFAAALYSETVAFHPVQKGCKPGWPSNQTNDILNETQSAPAPKFILPVGIDGLCGGQRKNRQDSSLLYDNSFRRLMIILPAAC